jgi:hypothetical protein
VARVHVFDPLEHAALGEQRAQLRDAAVLGLARRVREAGRLHAGADQGGEREVGDREAAADQIAARLELVLEAIDRLLDALPRPRDGARSSGASRRPWGSPPA